MELFAVAHQIDTEIHSTIPTGWRWAVYRSDRFDDALECYGAGWAPDEQAAVFISDQAAIIAVKALRAAGVDVTFSNHLLRTDPIAAGQDFLKVG